jgi:hypothetical protein
MLYRYTLTCNIDEENQDKTEKLKTAIKNEAEWIGANVNVKVEDEYCSQANKKRLVAPIITTLDTTTLHNDKNIYLSYAKLLLENLKSIDESNKDYDDYRSALITAINCLSEKGSRLETEKTEESEESSNE